MPELDIDNYLEAAALYRILLSYKYATNPMHPELFGSSLIAQNTTRITETLNAMEIEQGHQNNSWNRPIQVGSSVWTLLIANTLATTHDWLSLDEHVKQQLAEIALTP